MRSARLAIAVFTAIPLLAPTGLGAIPMVRRLRVPEFGSRRFGDGATISGLPTFDARGRTLTELLAPTHQR